jgi:hypothetical protein
VANQTEFANKRYDKYTARFYNEGFREALSAVQDEADGLKTTANSNAENILQKSFDCGYASCFQVARQLSTARVALKVYLEMYKDDGAIVNNRTSTGNDHGVEDVSHVKLRELKRLNLDLDEAQIKLAELVKSGIDSAAVIPSFKTSDTANDNNLNDHQSRIVELDQSWRSKINDLIDFKGLSKRMVELLGDVGSNIFV